MANWKDIPGAIIVGTDQVGPSPSRYVPTLTTDGELALMDSESEVARLPAGAYFLVNDTAKADPATGGAESWGSPLPT